MVIIENLYMGFAGRTLFESANLTINRKERIGLVGRNGHGKTTLLSLIAGEILPDEGAITTPKHYRIGYMKQEADFREDSVLKEACRSLGPAERNDIWKAERVLGGLGFERALFDAPTDLLSEGFRIRLELAKVLLLNPDLLLLDEPTNFLDITSIRWLGSFLSKWPGEMILITHDRGFMDQTVTHIAGINRKKIRKIQGDTLKYHRLIREEEEHFEKTRVKQERKRKEVQEFIARFRAKARQANLVQSRIKTLEKQKQQAPLEQERCLRFSFSYSSFEAKQILKAANISFGYGEKRIIENFSLDVRAGDRIGIVGRNGMGKTTLIRLLSGDLLPEKGEVIMHQKAVPAIFQPGRRNLLNKKRSVAEEILSANTDLDRTAVRNICAAMLFEGEDAEKKVEVLSGGEKSRLLLGRIIAAPSNILYLDEPTNHLDMDASEALLKALESFPGTVIFVTHNETFLRRLARRLVVFDEKGCRLFWGTYDDFLEKEGWEEDKKRPGIPSGTARSGPGKNRKNLRKIRSRILAERSARIAPVKKRMQTLEDEIDKTEHLLADYNDEMIRASMLKPERIKELANLIKSCQNSIEKAFDELEELELKLAEIEKSYNRRLMELG